MYKHILYELTVIQLLSIDKVLLFSLNKTSYTSTAIAVWLLNDISIKPDNLVPIINLNLDKPFPPDPRYEWFHYLYLSLTDTWVVL